MHEWEIKLCVLVSLFRLILDVRCFIKLYIKKIVAKYVFYIYLKNAWINLKSGLFWAYLCFI